MDGMAFPGSDAVREDLLRRWSEPHRRYHDLRHLEEVLAALPDDAPRAVLLAAWYHDAVYDPARDDNEAASARLAREQLAGESELAEVERLVLLTRAHDPAEEDVSGAMLSDADLAVLGASPERYAEYTSDVRHEYAHVSDGDFRHGRTRVLAGLLALTPLYRTERGRERWEEAARTNLSRELAALVDPSAGAAPPG
jgi:predicted metal-dependent HD superfamily phosphohydrolase